MSLHPNEVLLAPVVSEKSYSLINDNKYSFKVHPDAHKTQVRQAVEELFEVKVLRVNISKVQPKPKRRGLHKGVKQGWKKAIVQVARVNIVKVQPKPKRRGQIRGTKQGWKKAIVQLKPGYTIEFFEGAQL